MTKLMQLAALQNQINLAFAPLDQFEVMSVYSAGETILFNNLSLVLLFNLGLLFIF